MTTSSVLQINCEETSCDVANEDQAASHHRAEGPLPLSRGRESERHSAAAVHLGPLGSTLLLAQRVRVKIRHTRERNTHTHNLKRGNVHMSSLCHCTYRLRCDALSFIIIVIPLLSTEFCMLSADELVMYF